MRILKDNEHGNTADRIGNKNSHKNKFFYPSFQMYVFLAYILILPKNLIAYTCRLLKFFL